MSGSGLTDVQQAVLLAVQEHFERERLLRTRRTRVTVEHARRLRRLSKRINSLQARLDDGDVDTCYALAQLSAEARDAALPPPFLTSPSEGHERSRPTLEELEAAVVYYERMIAKTVKLAKRLRALAADVADRDRSEAGIAFAEELRDVAAAHEQLADHLRRELLSTLEDLALDRYEPAETTPVVTGTPASAPARQPVLCNAPPRRHGSAQLTAS